MAASVLVALKTLFIVLTCIITAALAYLLAMDWGSSCVDPSRWWTQVMVTDFFVFMIPTVAWFFYKESSWIKISILIFIMFWCGSLLSCGYITMLLFKLSPEESLKDPLYFVLARHQNGDAMRHKKRSYVVTVKVIVTLACCYLLGIIIYGCIIDGFPFYKDVLTPCMITTMIDVSIQAVVFSVWILYKESSWISALIWIVLLVCFSGIGLCVYIMKELFTLAPDEPASLILFNKSNRDVKSSEPLLIEHSNV